jgi:hypothetical protein
MRIDEAVEEYKQAIGFKRGSVRGLIDEAIEDYKEVIKLKPANPDARFKLGCL